MKLSRAPTYGLDGVLVSGSGVRRLVRASQDAPWDALGPWAGLASLCGRTRTPASALFAVLRRTPVVAEPPDARRRRTSG
ncbi:hypothetical protein, partial [Streptomyces sp. NPDC059744]|uniref:hypothetical protein n=1 Tax=Streptomyces sp. NPDC059744 TaxID=3346929 RepID=UPI0036502E8F